MTKSDDIQAGERLTSERHANKEIEELAHFLQGYIATLKSHVRLLFALFAVLIPIWLILFLMAKSSYTATAIIGPPNPSPINGMMSMMGGTSATGGMARRLLGGASGGNSNDPFQEYQQLLASPRLTLELSRDDAFMSQIFYKRWDGENKRWYPPGALFNTISAVKRFLKRPVSEHPNSVDLAKYFENKFQIEKAKGIGSSEMATLSSMASTYFELTLEADDPQTAERLLGKILDKADYIIRQEQLRDVKARISYIEEEIPQITRSEEKEALIQTLASQEELKVMMVADKRFSYVLVSSPYASPEPTRPTKPSKGVMTPILLSFVLWFGLAGLEPRSKLVRKLMVRFKSKKARQAES